MVCFVVIVRVAAHEQGEDGGQQHEDECLHEADEQLHEVKWNRNQPRESGHDVRHGFEHVFPRENIAEETKAERNGAEENRDDFEQADEDEDARHRDFQEAGHFLPRRISKDVNDRPADAIRLDGPHDPADEKDARHREGHVQVRIHAAEKRTADVGQGPLCIRMSPTDRSHAGDQTGPIREQDENENRREEPECFLHQDFADDAFEKVVKALDEEFPKILCVLVWF